MVWAHPALNHVLLSQSAVLILRAPLLSIGNENKKDPKGGNHLSCGIKNVQCANLVVHFELLAVRILDSWIVLQTNHTRAVRRQGQINWGMVICHLLWEFSGAKSESDCTLTHGSCAYHHDLVRLIFFSHFCQRETMVGNNR